MSIRAAVVVTVLLLTSHAFAQEPIEIEAFEGGGSGSDVGQAAAVGLDGSFVVVGEFEQTATFGSLTVTSADAPDARSDVFVVKYDALGTPVWARRMGTGVFNDFAGGVAGSVTLDFVVVSGYFTGIATFDGGDNPDIELTTRNDFDAFVAAYDGAGNLLWVQQAGGPEQDVGRGVIVDEDDNVYATGGFAGTATWGDAVNGDTTIVSAGFSDGFLAKYDPDGGLLWVRTVGGEESDDVRDVAFFEDGGTTRIFTTGTFRGVAFFGANALQSRGLSDAYVALYSTAGGLSWAHQIGANGNDYGRGIAASSRAQHAVWVTGSFENTMLVGTDVLVSAGASDVFLVTMGANGVFRRGLRGGGAGFDIGNDVAMIVWGQFNEPGPVVAGYIDGDATFEPETFEGGEIEVEGRGFTDGFVAGVQDVNSFAWFRRVEVLGGPNADRGYGIGSAPSDAGGRVVAVGAFRDTGIFADTTLVSVGSNDVYAAAFDSCDLFSTTCVVAGEPGPAERVSLSSAAPNPFTDGTRLTLTLGRSQGVRIEVVDVLGRHVATLFEGTMTVGAHAVAVGGAGLAPGVYLVRVFGDDFGESRLVVRGN